MPRCFGVPVGAGEQPAVVGVVRARAPQLLPVDDPLVTVALGARREAREVGSVAGLTEQLAPRVLAGQDRPEEALPDHVRTVGKQRRGRETGPHSERRANRTRGRDLLIRDVVCPGREVAARPRPRPRRARPTRVDQALATRAAGGRIPLLGQPRGTSARTDSGSTPMDSILSPRGACWSMPACTSSGHASLRAARSRLGRTFPTTHLHTSGPPRVGAASGGVVVDLGCGTGRAPGPAPSPGRRPRSSAST